MGHRERMRLSLRLAKISAEKITDDEQALKVADLYDLWSGDGVATRLESILLTKMRYIRYSKTIHLKRTGRRTPPQVYMLRCLQIRLEKYCRGSSQTAQTHTKKVIG